MKKEIPCPLCNYPMETELVKKGGTYKARIENLVCPCCKHTERAPSVAEKMRLEGELKKINFKK